MPNLPIVALVGRPNSGKSSLFNRIVGQRISIVDDVAGVTRDRIYGVGTWLTRQFEIIDTGGITLENAPFQTQIKMQAQIAIDMADIIVLVCDGQAQMSNDDYNVAKLLKKTNKTIIVAVNKIDNIEAKNDMYPFYQLGFKNVFAISSTHAIGVGDLLDEVIKDFPPVTVETKNNLSLAILGRPNVGKSSLVNTLLAEPRLIVSDVAGTTRDAVDVEFSYEDFKATIIDTAGIVRKGRIQENLDKFSYQRSLSALKKADIGILMLSAEDGFLEQDKHILGAILDEKKGVMIVVNKWDIKNSEDDKISFTKKIREALPFIEYIPIFYCSATKPSVDINNFISIIKSIDEARHYHIDTSTFNLMLNDAQMINPPSNFNSGVIKLYYGIQLEGYPIKFVLFVNHQKHMHFTYERYLLNRIRQVYPFKGVNIELIYRKHN